MAYDFGRMSTEELQHILSGAQTEMKRRKDARCDKLIQRVCDAMNELHKEFPHVQLTMDYDCPECGIGDARDVIDYFCRVRPMDIHDFYID